YVAEPYVAAFLDAKPAEIEFSRVHVALGREDFRLAQLTFALSQIAGTHDAAFDGAAFSRYHVQHRPFQSTQDAIDFLSALDPRTRWSELVLSGALQERVNQLEALTRAAGIQRTPTFIINGQFYARWSSDADVHKFAALLVALSMRPPMQILRNPSS